MKPTRTCIKPVHPADAGRISFRDLSAEAALATLKVKAGPKEPKARTSKYKNASKIALVVLAINALLSSFPIPLRGEPGPNDHDLSAQVKVFENYFTDFHEMEGPLHGEDLEEADFLEQTAFDIQERLYASNAMLRMYDNISCKADRAKVKTILKAQLDYSSWRLNEAITRTSGSLSFIKIPALATEGLRMKDDLRAAKDKMDNLSASLPD
jgi:hypothetical protein